MSKRRVFDSMCCNTDTSNSNNSDIIVFSCRFVRQCKTKSTIAVFICSISTLQTWGCNCLGDIRYGSYIFAKFESNHGIGFKHYFACVSKQTLFTIHKSLIFVDPQHFIVSTQYGFTITFPIMCGWIVQ